VSRNRSEIILPVGKRQKTVERTRPGVRVPGAVNPPCREDSGQKKRLVVAESNTGCIGHLISKMLPSSVSTPGGGRHLSPPELELLHVVVSTPTYSREILYMACNLLVQSGRVLTDHRCPSAAPALLSHYHLRSTITDETPTIMRRFALSPG